MFRVDQDYVIDATKKGNLARFINHCCDVSVNGGPLKYKYTINLPGERIYIVISDLNTLTGKFS